MWTAKCSSFGIDHHDKCILARENEIRILYLTFLRDSVIMRKRESAQPHKQARSTNLPLLLTTRRCLSLLFFRQYSSAGYELFEILDRCFPLGYDHVYHIADAHETKQ